MHKEDIYASHMINMKNKLPLIILIIIFLVLSISWHYYKLHITKEIKDKFISIYVDNIELEKEDELYRLYKGFKTLKEIYGNDYKFYLKKWKIKIKGNQGYIYIKYIVDFYAEGNKVFADDNANNGFRLEIEKQNNVWKVIKIKTTP